MKSLSPDTKRWIKPLPERVINKIAAGEVIERPAAVVKELVENAIDASADRIEIIIEKAGAKLIKIVDNGCGIPKDQIEIAFSRHATSKISSFDDLYALNSYGFRGEALPSVASVSRLRMVSRPTDQQSGYEIIYEGGVLQSKEPIAASPGTTVEVENLFFNTPARRKFLKAESTESRHISRTAMGMALSRPEIGFIFKTNGKTIFNLPPKSTLQQRVQDIIGQEKKLVEVSGEMGPVKLFGYIGTPEFVQHNRNAQFLFVNNRFIQSPTISHALVAGYGEMIPRGKFPIGVLSIEVALDQIDVNVHPTKAEIRLSHEREVHDSVYRLIKNSLRDDGIIPVFNPADSDKQNSTTSHTNQQSNSDYSNQSAAYIPGVNQSQQGNNPSHAGKPSHAGNPLDLNLLKELYQPANPSANSGEADIVSVDRTTGEIIRQDEATETISDGFRLIGRFSDLYLLLQAGQDLYIVDQHTAHERVLYEEMLIKVEESSINGQALLFPVQIELDPEQLVLFEDALETLNNSGFTVGHFGGRTVNVEAVPSILKNKAPEKLFLKILDDIGSLKKSGYDLKKAIAQSVACRSAVMAGDRINDAEATNLLKNLLKCVNRYTCPHGRPTFIKLSRQNLDKQFGRT